MFRNTKIKTGGRVFTKAVEEVPSPPQTSKKHHKRKEINDAVFDLHDSVADTAKWASLLTGFVIRIYNALDQETKDRLDPADKQLIDDLAAAFAITPTRLDVQIQQEGFTVIDRMLKRQEDVANILQDL